MRHIYILFSEIGWGWAVIVFAFLLFVKGVRDRDGAKDAKQAAEES